MSEKVRFTVVTRKGQITVPAEIRKALNLKVGDKVSLSVSDQSKAEATLRPVRSVAEMTFASVKPRKRPEDFGQLRQAFEDEVAEEAQAEIRAPDRDRP